MESKINSKIKLNQYKLNNKIIKTKDQSILSRKHQNYLFFLNNIALNKENVIIIISYFKVS